MASVSLASGAASLTSDLVIPSKGSLSRELPPGSLNNLEPF